MYSLKWIGPFDHLNGPWSYALMDWLVRVLTHVQIEVFKNVIILDGSRVCLYVFALQDMQWQRSKQKKGIKMVAGLGPTDSDHTSHASSDGMFSSIDASHCTNGTTKQEKDFCSLKKHLKKGLQAVHPTTQDGRV